MLDLIQITTTRLASCFKSRATLQLENIALRHQINMLRKSAPERLRQTHWDLLIFATLLRAFVPRRGR